MGQSLLIENGQVLLPGGRLERTDILIVDGSIVEVGVADPPSAVPRLDATGMLIAPGLVNAHYHSGENYNPGLYENLPLDLWFVHSHQVARTEPLEPDAIYARTLLGAVLMLRTGTTSVVDFLFEAPEITIETLEPVVRAYRDVGIRATILLGVVDKPFVASLPVDDRQASQGQASPSRAKIMELASAAVERWHEPDGMVGIGLGPSAPQRCTDELLDATSRFAQERGLAWQTHVLETKTQAWTAQKWHGRSFVEVLEERGLLGPHAALAHTIWLTDRDIEIMHRTGTTSVHCLLSNLRLGDGIARIPALRDAGVRLALGTDGRGCDETLDMFELTKMAALVHKARGGDHANWPTASETWSMATAGGSVCTGHGERLGRIEAGARGDVILLPLDSPALTPLNDPVRQLVYGAPSRDVSTVVVDGRVVVEGGEVVTTDVGSLLARVRGYASAALSALGADTTAVESIVEEVYQRAEEQELGVNAYIR